MHYVNNNNISGTSQLLYGVPDTRYQEGKKTGKERKEKKKCKLKPKQIYMRSGSRPTPEGSRLLFAGDTVSPMMCPADRQPKDDKKGHTEDKPRLGQRQSRKKQDYTATRGWLLVECGSAWCLEVIRCV